MTLSDNATKILANLQAHQIIAIDQYAADLSFYSRTLAKLITEQHQSVPCYIFSLAEGLKKMGIYSNGETFEPTTVLDEPQGADPLLYYLEAYHQYEGDGIFILQDLHQYLKPPNSDRLISSFLQAIATNVKQTDNFKRMILLGQEIELPNELLRLIPVIVNQLPSADKRQAALNQKLTQLNSPKFNLGELVKATSGLTFREIYDQLDCYYHKCVYQGGEIAEIDLVNHFVAYKTKLLKALKIEVIQPQQQTFGGHGALNSWLEGVKAILAPQARDFGIPFPKGFLLGGVSGVGKTLVAEAISSKWHLPLIKLSIPALKGSLVGESESNLKQALNLIQLIEGVVLIDEVEKAVAGAKTDSSGVTGGMLSILLDYMQTQTHHLVILTANDVTQIPAELLRKGRLDEVWFAGLPNREEREEILKIHFFKENRILPEYISQVNQIAADLAERTPEFSGAELAALVNQGLTNVFLDGRGGKPESADFMPLTSSIIPLAKAQPEQHQAVVEWSKKARNTSLSKSNANHTNQMLRAN